MITKNIIKTILAFIVVAILGFLTSWVLWSEPQPQRIIPTVITNTVNDIKGKKALFIGDSHTANHGYGWQVQPIS